MPFRKGDPKPANSGRGRKKLAQHRIETVYRPIAWFQPYERNPRKNDKAVERIRASIREFGFAVPILARSTGAIIDGHLRLKGAVLEKLAELPVILCDGWSEAQVKAFRLMVNRSVTWAEWDLDALALEFADIKGLDFDLSMTGFDTREIDALLLKPNTAEDDVPPVPDAPVTRPGDLWLMGPHRLLCGDSTNGLDVLRLLDGKRAALCLTDPPYGVGEKYATYTDTPENLRRLVDEFLPLARLHSDRILLTPGNRNQHLYPTPDWTLCWFVAAGTGMNPWGFSCWQPVLAYGSCPYLKKGLGSRPDALALTESADNKLGHPCSKPVRVWSWFVERGSAKSGDVVFDPFAGSGTGFVACEQLHRVCCGLEIDPAYCDVIVTRWQNLTGKKATLDGHAGSTFEHVKFGRFLGEQDAIKESVEELTA